MEEVVAVEGHDDLDGRKNRDPYNEGDRQEEAEGETAQDEGDGTPARRREPVQGRREVRAPASEGAPRLGNLWIAGRRTHDAQEGEGNRPEDGPEDHAFHGEVHGEAEDRDPEEPHEETVQGRIRPEPKREQPRRPTVPLAIADVLDAEGLDLQGRAAVLDRAAVRLAFRPRVRDLLRIPGLKKSSRSLRRHDPDQVPRVSPSRGRLSALLGSPGEGAQADI